MIKAPKNKLVNFCKLQTQKCDACGDLLRHSNWRNSNVFYSTSKYWDEGFLCVRCLPDKVSKRMLDMYVKKNPTIFYIRTTKSQHCKRGEHDFCQWSFNPLLNCKCLCHKLVRKTDV